MWFTVLSMFLEVIASCPGARMVFRNPPTTHCAVAQDYDESFN